MSEESTPKNKESTPKNKELTSIKDSIIKIISVTKSVLPPILLISLWLLFFGAGTSGYSYAYRMSFRCPTLEAMLPEIKYLVLYLIFWTWTNVLILSCIASCIGALFRKGQENEKDRNFAKAIVRGVGVYFGVLFMNLVITGSFLLNSSEDVTSHNTKRLIKEVLQKYSEGRDITDIEELNEKTVEEICENILNKEELNDIGQDSYNSLKDGTLSATVEEYVRMALVVSLLSFVFGICPGLFMSVIDELVNKFVSEKYTRSKENQLKEVFSRHGELFKDIKDNLRKRQDNPSDGKGKNE